MDQWGPQHVELTYVMNKTHSLKNFAYLVGLHIYVLDTSLSGLLKLLCTCLLIVLQYHTDIKLLHLCRACVCSHCRSRYTDNVNLYFTALGFLQGIYEQGLLYISSFATPFFGVIFMNLNRSGVKRRPHLQHFSFCTCIVSLPGDGQSDWPKHVAGWYKSESAKVRGLCFCVGWYCR